MSHLEVVMPLTSKVSGIAALPFIVCMVPIIGAVIVGLVGKKEKLRDAVTVATTFIAFVLVLFMYGPVVKGIHIGEHFYKGIEFNIQGILGMGFRVDPVSLMVALVTSFLWFIASIYAISYMSHEHARTRFAIFSLLTLGVDLGVLLASDFFSLFVFFELLGIFSTMLVIHEEDEKALNAGKLYLWFCIIFGLVLLAGTVLLFAYTGTVDIKPMAKLLEKVMPAYMRYLVATLFIMGFGAKAGLFFLHVWLPEAHPVAPTPASALLSGVMVKAGAYGILRSVHTLYAPTEGAASVTLTNLGYGLILMGALTMIGGALNALISSNCKRMLAYSTVSQVGYIVFGLGCAAYLGKEGAMGVAGSLYHIINHALFKGALFLSVGAVYFRTHELDMRKLGGLWRNMPFTAVVCLIAVFGIAGIPFFNGFVSKTLLHHSIIEAWQHSGDPTLLMAEIILMMSAFAAWVYGMKLWIMVFAGKRPEKYKTVEPAPLPMLISLVTLATCIVFIGLRPNWLLEKIVGPALAFFGYEPSSHAYHVLYNTHISGGIRSTIPILYDPKTLSFFNAEVLHNLIPTGLAVLGGGLFFVIGFRFGWFKLEGRTPEALSIKHWYLELTDMFQTMPAELVRLKEQFRRRVTTYLLSGEEDRRKKIVSRLISGVNEQKERAEKLRAIRDAVNKLDRGVFRLDRAELYELRKVFRTAEEPLVNDENLSKADLRVLRDKVAALEVNPKQLSKEDTYWLRKMLMISEKVMVKEHAIGEEKLARLQQTAYNLEKVRKEIVKDELKGVQQRGFSLDELKAEERRIREAGMEGISRLAELSAKAEKLIQEERIGPVLQKTLFQYRRAQLSYRIISGSILKEMASWVRRMVLVSMMVLSEERFGGIEQAIYSAMDIKDTRNAIRSYTRDIGFNVLIVVVMVVLLSGLLLQANMM